MTEVEQEVLQGDGPAVEDEDSLIAPSILDQLREKRKQVTEERFLDIQIPGYEGLLMARYKTVPFSVFEAAEKKQRKDKSAPRLLLAALDQIILTCDQILVKDPGHHDCVTDNDGHITEYRPIDPTAAEQGVPVRWDSRLADLIGIDEQEHRGQQRLVVLRTFCNDSAVIYHAQQIGIWLRDTTKDADEELLGE